MMCAIVNNRDNSKVNDLIQYVFNYAAVYLIRYLIIFLPVPIMVTKINTVLFKKIMCFTIMYCFLRITYNYHDYSMLLSVFN